jgi:hypothetical protein
MRVTIWNVTSLAIIIIMINRQLSYREEEVLFVLSEKDSYRVIKEKFSFYVNYNQNEMLFSNESS